ncbi:hypothetical protein [Pseudomonas fluorescens]|uniref:hypothetical protein n=1 Tax=Pseudomonas fluorescens TaxID=294 RepID=UPI000FF76C59|nr:hypothetical protein [Pseudomonas fluorescens]RON88416.1 hypothetical protein BK668_15775 [Pseudomonas fluorescens]
MDPSDIENTDDWLGCPTPLETCRHQLAFYENEFEELNLQLRHARERIFKLVEMHAEISKECDTLRSQLIAAKAEAAEANSRASDIETRSNWELMAKGRHISELTTQIRTLKGDSPFKDPFPHQRETDRT